MEEILSIGVRCLIALSTPKRNTHAVDDNRGKQAEIERDRDPLQNHIGHLVLISDRVAQIPLQQTGESGFIEQRAVGVGREPLTDIRLHPARPALLALLSGVSTFAPPSPLPRPQADHRRARMSRLSRGHILGTIPADLYLPAASLEHNDGLPLKILHLTIPDDILAPLLKFPLALQPLPLPKPSHWK